MTGSVGGVGGDWVGVLAPPLRGGARLGGGVGCGGGRFDGKLKDREGRWCVVVQVLGDGGGSRLGWQCRHRGFY